MISDFSYEQLLHRIRELLNEGLQNGELYSYNKLAEKLDTTPDIIKEVVGRRFKQLTQDSKKAIFSHADPDLFLLGDNIEEIHNNRYYRMYRNFKQGAGGIIGKLGRLLH